MIKNKHVQRGFSVVIFCIFLLVAFIVGVAIWKIVSANNLDKTDDSSQKASSFNAKSTDYDSCMKSPDATVTETYPEQCVSQGRTFSTPQQQTATSVRSMTASEKSDLLSAYETQMGLCKISVQGEQPKYTVTANVYVAESETWVFGNMNCGAGWMFGAKKVSGEEWEFKGLGQDQVYCASISDFKLPSALLEYCAISKTAGESTDGTYIKDDNSGVYSLARPEDMSKATYLFRKNPN